MEKTWKITISDGTELSDLALNGNNFVSEEEITEDIFEGNLTKVTIEGTDEEGNAVTEEHTNMELVQIAHYKDGYYFILRDITDAELDKMKMQANIDYLAMMTDIDLDEEE